MTAPELLERGTALRLDGRYAEAIRLLDQAARLAPDDPRIWLERGIVFDLGGSLDNALLSYGESARLGGGAPALAGYASMAARKSDYPRARAAAVEALRLFPGEPTASIALAKCEIEDRDLTGAETRLRAVLRADPPEDVQTVAGILLGDVLDGLDRPAEAFAEYARAKGVLAALHGPHFFGQLTSDGFIDAIADAYRSRPPEEWTAPAEAVEGPVSNHIFLLGHPRSGTTLVENILATAPGVEAVEERPTLREADQVFLDPPGKLAELVDADAAALSHYRRAYWQRVRQSGVSAAATAFVDMDPFKGSRLPMIARLFPAAKIVLMRRDPRDVVLSCFRTSFASSAAVMQFATLEGAARHYDALMRLQEDCRANLSLAFHELRYEDLVGDFDVATRALCDFTGLPWSEELRRFDQTAARRGVTTASQTQVRRGLYDGRAQWRRYEAELTPILSILQPWIECFGYAGTP